VHTESDGGQQDGGTPDAGEDPDPGPMRIACIDRGMYAVEFTEVRGLSKTCDDRLICLNDECVQPPACTKGISHECLFRPEGAHGALAGVKTVGDYVYWVEGGTYDDRTNYENNGAIARARVGTWQREELANSLPLHSPFAHEYVLDLRVAGDLVFVQLEGAPQSWQTYRIPSLPGQAVVRDPHLDAVPLYSTCVGKGQQFWSDGIKVYRRSLSALDNVQELATVEGLQTNIPTCVAGDGFLVLSDANPKVSFLIATDGSGVWRELSPRFSSFAISGSRVVGYDGWWIVTAPVNVNTAALELTRVAGGSLNLYGSAIWQDHVYWLHAEENRADHIVIRAKLDGSGVQEVVAERFDLFGNEGPYLTTPTWRSERPACSG
jgi:hypothetical protein